MSRAPDNYSRTLEWIFTKDHEHHFVSWLKRGSGPYWIKGLPAAGKSTLMKLIAHDRRTVQALPVPRTTLGWILIPAFFHGRGEEVQKTFDGLLRSILQQILKKIKDDSSTWNAIMPSILQLWRHDTTGELVTDESANKRSVMQGAWSELKIQEALRMVTQRQDIDLDILVMVDALDEHQGDPSAMSKFLFDTFSTTQFDGAHIQVQQDTLGIAGEKSAADEATACSDHEAKREVDSGQDTRRHGIRVKLLVASREDEPEIRKVFDHCRDENKLTIHEFTAGDIKRYVMERLSEHEKMRFFLQPTKQELRDDPHRSFLLQDAEDLMATIVRNAQGVWLWVALVVTDLLLALGKATTPAQLHDVLRNIPNDLPEYYADILKKIADEDRLEAFILFELILRTRQPWAPDELTHVEAHANQKVVARGRYVDFELQDTEETRKHALRCWKDFQAGAPAMEYTISTRSCAT